MSKIGCVYFSHSGVTGQLAEDAVAEVVKLGGSVLCHQIKNEEITSGRFTNLELLENLCSCDGIIFASPTYMGNAAAQFKAFADASSDLWETQAWSGKIAAGITSGSSLNGDQSFTLQYFATLAAQHGMLWLGLDTPTENTDQSLNRLGCQLGVSAHSVDGSVHPIDRETSRYLGGRVFQFATRLSF